MQPDFKAYVVPATGVLSLEILRRACSSGSVPTVKDDKQSGSENTDRTEVETMPEETGVRVRNGSPTFYALLNEMADTHDSKSHDYASNDNPSGNYHFAGQLAVLFAHSPKDAGFIGRIGEKLYRLANLESGGKTPKNESVEDTERDICVITALW